SSPPKGPTAQEWHCVGPTQERSVGPSAQLGGTGRLHNPSTYFWAERYASAVNSSPTTSITCSVGDRSNVTSASSVVVHLWTPRICTSVSVERARMVACVKCIPNSD